MNKKEEKEIEVEKEKKEEKNEYVNYQRKKNKKSSKVGYIVTIVILSLILIVLAILLGIKLGEKKSNTGKSIGNVELNYTERVETESNGVYITDVSEVVDKVMPSIVAITSKTVISSGRFGPSYYGGSYTAVGAGSGVIVSENDDKIFILTNYHVIEDTTELSVKFIDDKSYDAKVVGGSEKNDVAIVSVNKSDIDSSTLESIKIATLGDSDSLKVGNGIIAIGNALGYGQSVTTGVVSALDREVKTDEYTQKMIQIDAAINGGNSGGALLNNKGEVVGINSVKYSTKALSNSPTIEGMGFAIPISDVKDLITSLMNGESEDETEGPMIGIEGSMVTDIQAKTYNIPTGVYIAKIIKNSGAHKAGLEVGNIITEIEGNKVTQFTDITNVVQSKKKGDKIKLKVSYASGRTYKEKTVEVTLS